MLQFQKQSDKEMEDAMRKSVKNQLLPIELVAAEI